MDRHRVPKGKRWVAVSATLPLVVAISLLTSRSAVADDYPNNYYPDANPHTYCIDLMPSKYYDDIHSIEKNSLGDPTEVVV